MQVCEHIVIPNIRLRDDMEEMFEMNWVEYVRRDTEGSDNDTRRRAATDLVKALTARFEAPVSTRPDACSAKESHSTFRRKRLAAEALPLHCVCIGALSKLCCLSATCGKAICRLRRKFCTLSGIDEMYWPFV